MAEAQRDGNHVPAALGQSSTDSTLTLPFKIDSTTGRLLVDTASGSGTVTSVSVVSANGFAGTVANSTTTPAITLTTTINSPVLAGNGTAISAASTTGSGSTVVLATAPVFPTTITVGAAAGTTGSILWKGTTSGTVTIKVADAAGTYTLTLPTTDGNASEFLQTDGNGVLTWAAGASGANTALSNLASVAINTTLLPGLNDGAGLGSGLLSFSDLFLASGALINYANGDVVLTHSAGILTVSTGDLRVTTAGTNAASVVTVGGTQTLTNKSLSIGQVTGLGTGVATALAINVGSAGAFVTFNGALGTPSSGTVTNLTGTASININGTVGATTPAAGTFTAAIANSFVPNSSTVPSNGLYLPAANTLGWAINSAAEMQLTSTALSPAADGGSSLGTTALGWQNLFGNTGFVFNLENGDWVATHTAGILTVGTGDLRVTTAGTNSASVVTVGGTQTLTSKTLTSPTLTTPSAFTTGGTITLAENTSIALDPAGSADGKYTGITVTGTAGTTLAFGDLIYLAVADSRWELTDADASATGGPVMIGMCVLAAAADGDPTTILLKGIIRADAKFPTLTVGAAVYLGETAGAVQVAIPTGADNVIRVVGFAMTADEMYFNPSQDHQITVA